MKDQLLISPAIRRFLQIWSWIGITIVLMLSILDIIGWIFDFPFLKGFSSYYIAMKFVTAITFLLFSSAFIILALDLKGRIRDLTLRLIAMITGIISLLSIICYIGFSFTGKELYMTTLPILDLFLAPGLRMALLTACSFLIISMALFLLSTNRPQAAGVAHGLIMFPLSLNYLVILSYLLGVHHIHEIQGVAVALNTSMSFFLLCIVLLFLNPRSWIMNKFTGNYAGSLMARKLLPGVILLPAIIAWLRIQGEQQGLFISEVGVTFVALTYTLCFLGLVWLTAYSVNRSDKERARNENFLSEAQRIAKIGSWEWNVQTGKIFWSDEMYRMFGEKKGKFIPTYEGFLSHVHPDDRQIVEDAVKETIEQDIPFKIEYRILTTAGIESYVSAHADVIRKESNEVELFIGTFHDISDRRRYEEALQASRESLSTTLASIGDAVIATDIQGNVTFLNRVGEDLTGWNYEDAIGKPVNEIFNIINEQTRLAVESPVTKVLETGTIVGLANHTLLVRKDGTEIPIDDSGAPIHGSNGQIAGVVLVFRDITLRKKAEKKIHESEQRLRFHFENSPLAVVEWDANYIVTEWSVEAERMFGWTKEETIGKPIGSLNMIVEEDIPIVENTMKKLSSGIDRTVVSTNRNYTKDGSIIECTWFNSVLVDEEGEMSSVMSLVQDITEQKKAERALVESERRFRLALKNAPVNVAIQDKDLVFRWAYNQKSWRPEEIIGKKDDDLFSEDDVKWIKPLKEELLEKGNEVHAERWITSNGRRFFLGLHFEPLVGPSGEIDGIGIAAVDLTERKLIEEALQESEKKHRELIKYAPTGIYEIDFHSRKFVTINDAMTLLSGYSKEELLSMDAMDILVEESRRLFLSRLNKMMKGDIPVENVEYKIRRKDGQIRDIVLNMKFIMDEQGKPKGAFCIGHDITERKLGEEIVRTSEAKLKEIYESMTEGLALHDVVYDKTGKAVDYIITEVNPAYENITTLKRNDILGRKGSEIYSITEAPYLDQYAEVASSGKPYSFETYFSPMNKHFLISAFCPAKGKFGTVFQDITTRKLAEEALQDSQERFRSVLDNSIDVIYRFNLQTRKFEYFSPASKDVFGYTSEEFMEMDEQTATSRIHPEDLARVQAMLAELNESGVGKLDYRFRIKDGDYRWISNHLTLIRDDDGRPLYRDGNVRDITELKKIEQEIIAANEELTIFNSAMVGRELRMIELKKEINRLCAQLNQPPVYEIENEEVLS